LCVRFFSIMLRIAYSLLSAFAADTVFAADPLAGPRQHYENTKYQEALAALRDQPRDPETLLLLGKVHFGLEDFRKAQETLEEAVKAQPASPAWHWLGKAYGRRAETASFLSAPGLASKCRQAFEKSVSLDPANTEAMSDLLEYYLEAPGFLGGGTDKAVALAARIGLRDPAEHQFALARIAEKKKDYAAAEQHLRKAMSLHPGDIGRALDVASFLARRGRTTESDTAFQQAAAIHAGSPKLLFAQAQALVEAKRDLGRARQLLERYLKAALTPGDPPRSDAVKLLKKCN